MKQHFGKDARHDSAQKERDRASLPTLRRKEAAESAKTPNTAILKKEEWNVLVGLIQSGRLSKI